MPLWLLLAGIAAAYGVLLVYTWGLCPAAHMHSNSEQGE